MKSKVYVFTSYTIKHGPAYAIRKTAGYLKRSVTRTKKRIDIMADVADVVNADFINKPYKKPSIKRGKTKLEIGWVLSPISAGSGGHNTIMRFVRYLQSRGHNVTIYLYEAIHPQLPSEAQRILKESFKTEVQVKRIKDYEECDVVLATGWETAYPVFNLQTKAHKHYFVQDFEPLFFGLGSRAILAENTYKFGFYGVTAGRWLTERLSKDYGMRCDYFDFGVDLDIYKSDKIRKKKKICFYARPVTERRAFELGVLALSVFHERHPEYEIEFFGWDVSDYDIPFPYTNRGILSHEELGQLYREATACLVLSLTNVSLLPFELLAAGCIPVMNKGDNNEMVLGKNKYIKYTGASPVELASGLSEVVGSKRLDKEALAASRSVENKAWDGSYERMEKILLREVTGAK